MIKNLAVSFVLNLTLLLSIILPYSSGPGDLVTISVDRAQLRSVLEEIQQQTNITFVYADELVDRIKVSCSFRNTKVEEVLGRLLYNTGISFKVNGPDQIILYLDNIERMFNIYGKIVDRKTGEALPYASIALLASSRGVTANNEGWFSLKSVPFRNCMLSIHHIGYFQKTVPVNPESYMGNLVIELEENVLPAPTVVISEEINKEIISITKDAGRLTIAPSNFSDLPVIGDKDISRSLQLIPGITPGNYGASGLHIRGGLPSQNLVLLDGMTLYHTEHSFGFLNAFNPSAIKDIRVYKGAFPSRLGDRLSGVLELTTKSGDFHNFHVGSGTNQMSGQATVEVPLWGKGALMISGRRSISEFILGQLYDRVFNNIINNVVPALKTNNTLAAAPASYENKSRDIYFYDFLGKATAVPTEKDILTFTFFSSLDNIKNNHSVETGTSAPSYSELRTVSSNGLYKWGSEGLSLKWYRQWNPSFNSAVHLASSKYFVEDNQHKSDLNSWTYQKYPADSLKNLPQNSFSYTNTNDQGVLNNIKEVTLKNDFSLSLNENQELGFGYSYVRYETSFRNEENTIDQNLKNVKVKDTVFTNRVYNIDEFNENAGLTSLYVQDKWSPFPKLNAEIGLRTVYFDKTGRPEIEPRVSVNYLLFRNFVIKGAWGSYHQFILQCGDDFQNWYESRSWLLANGKEIKPASAEHSVIGMKYETDNILFDFEVFIKKMSNVIERENRTSRFLVNQSADSAKAGFLQHNENVRGVDILLQKKTGPLNGWISYSLSSAGAEYKGYEYHSSQDVPHNLNIVLNYFYNNWSVSATWQYSSGKPVLVPALTRDMKYNYLSYDPVKKNLERLPSIHSLNLSLTGKFSFYGLSLKTGVSVFNVYNQKNVWYRYFTIKNNAISPVDINMLGITPTFFAELQL